MGANVAEVSEETLKYDLLPAAYPGCSDVYNIFSLR